MNNIQDMLQRLIDGELDDAERIRLLRHLDQDAPEQWRDLALGFLEARLLADALAAHREDPARPVRSARPLRWRLAGLAAALVLGLGFGMLVTQAPPAAPEVAEQAAEDGRGLPRFGTLDIGATQQAGLEIPILDASGGAREASLAMHAASEPMRRIGAAYTKQGLQPELSTAYISTDLDNGKRLVVPVNYLAIPRSPGGKPFPKE